MKVGDLVMFKDDGTYAKWFRGKIAFVVKVGKGHCRVRWIHPVVYFDGFATVSDFSVRNFEVLNESR